MPDQNFENQGFLIVNQEFFSEVQEIFISDVFPLYKRKLNITKAT